MIQQTRFSGRFIRAHALGFGLGAALLALSACGDDTDSTPEDGSAGKDSSDGGKGGSSGKGGAGGEDEVAGKGGSGGAGGAGGEKADADTVIAFSLNIAEPEGYSEYLLASKDVPSGTVDSSKGVELKGGTFYYNENAIYYGNAETTTLQRYAIRKDLSIEKTGEFSLAKYGIEYVLNAPLFFSPTSAWYIDDTNEQLIHFNPTEMKILGEVPLTELHRDGYTWSVQGQGSQRSGDRYIASVTYWNEDDETPLETTVLILKDDATKPVVAVSSDKRATGAAAAFVNKGGDYYAIADGIAGALPYLLDTPVQPSLIRVKHDSDKIDPGYLLDLGELLNTPIVNGLWPVKDNQFVVQVWSGDTKPEDALKTDDDLFTAPHFDWYTVDAETKAFKKITGLKQPTTNSYSLLRLQDGEALYLQQYNVPDKDYAKSSVEVYKLNDDGSTTKAFDTKLGDIRAMGRVKIEDK